MDDLDQIDRLFSLKEKGALSEAEFTREKSRILGLDAEPTKQNSPQAYDDSKVYYDTRQGGYTTGNNGKIAAIIITVSVIALLLWAAKQSTWFSDARTLPRNDPTQTTENTPIIQKNLPRSAVEEPEPQEYQWFLTDEGGRLEALFGLPTSSAIYALTCLHNEGMIEFNEFEIERPSLITGQIGNDKGQAFRYNGEYKEDGLTSFGFMIPASDPLWKDVATGSSELRISPDDGEAYNIPISPKLTAFVSKCLAKNE